MKHMYLLPIPRVALNEMSFQEEKKKVANKFFIAENGWLRSG